MIIRVKETAISPQFNVLHHRSGRGMRCSSHESAHWKLAASEVSSWNGENTEDLYVCYDMGVTAKEWIEEWFNG